MIDNETKSNIATISLFTFILIYCAPVLFLFQHLASMDYNDQISAEDAAVRLVLNISSGKVDVVGSLHKLMLPLITFISGVAIFNYFGKIRLYIIILCVLIGLLMTVYAYYLFELRGGASDTDNYPIFSNFFSNMIATLSAYFMLLLGLTLADHNGKAVETVNNEERSRKSKEKIDKTI